MKRIERLELIDQVGRELQARMSYSDIDVYLRGFEVDCSKPTSDVNSKWVYVKDLLADEPEGKILEIADELGIDHGFSPSTPTSYAESRFWMPAHFRLFLSHLSDHRVKVSQLKNSLRSYGISGFVAHEDIEPTEEWQEEIEKALFSMDALVAVLTPGFKESNWTDQEVGVAVGRDVLVIPIRKGINPYGLIAKYQGLQGQGKTIGQVADEVFMILAKNKRSRPRMAEVLVDLVLMSKPLTDTQRFLGLLERFESLPQRQVERLRENACENINLVLQEDNRAQLNEILVAHDLAPVPAEVSPDSSVDEDFPF